MSGVFEHLDEIGERLAGLRDELLADAFAPDRAARLAAVFESEARAWSQLYELSCLRLVWRAALAAEAGARVNAALWAQRAAYEGAEVIVPAATAWDAGRPGAPHSPALTSTAAVSGVGGGR
jgi:hypothetical protein